MDLDPDRWERVQALFHDALELPEEERHTFLAEAGGADRPLVEAVSELLEADRSGSSLLDRELAAVAGDVLEEVPLPLRALGPYRLTRVLGRGGMGVVYLGERQDTGGRAAIKVLRDAALSPARRARFASEQRTLASLDHPSIARLYDADVLPDGTPYFVMEYVDGLPLTEYCRFWSSSLRERLAIYRSVCEAVQAAHQQAIVHRDLKPSNILVKGDGALKLLDFGIAKQLDGVDGTADPTMTALRVMTPAYAAPEQVRGGATGLYTDVYALGVLLYELLTGRQPLDLADKSPGEAERIIVEERPVRPSLVPRTGSGADDVRATRSEWSDLDVMCMAAMHKDPARRYGTVQGLIRDVEHFLRGEPLDAQGDSLAYRAGKFLRRKRRAVLAASVAVVASLGLVGFYTARLAVARDRAVAEAERTRRIQNFMLNLFSGGDESVGPADTLRVLTLIERGAREANALAGDPGIQTELLTTLGGLFQQMGSLERADSLLRTALDRRRDLSGETGLDVAESLVAMADLRVSQARLEEAERLVREGLAVASERAPPDHPVVLSARTTLGQALQESGRYDEAVEVLEEVVSRRFATAPGGPDHSGALTELANTHFYAGNYAAADSLNRIALDIDRERYGAQHPNVADGLINLGAVQFQWGRYAQAEELYREALGVIEGHYGPAHPETASALTMLSRALNYLGRSDEAVGHLRRARDVQLELFGPRHPAVASTENEIGLVALTAGDLVEAEASFRSMIETYDVVYADPHWLKGIARSNLAAVHLEAARFAEAEDLFREAVEIFTTTLSPDDLNTGVARIKLGRALLRQERWAEAEEESLAGYEIVSEISDPSVSWLQSARSDLASAYEALGRPAEAERFMAEAERYEG